MGDRTTGEFETEESLPEIEERFRVLIEGMAQVVWEAEAGGEVVADSPSWRAYTGQTPEEWMDRGWTGAVHADEREAAERQWREAFLGGRRFVGRFRLRQADGGWRWTEVRLAPLREAGGSIHKWVGMGIDVSERVEAEQAVAAARELAEATLDTVREPMLVLTADLRVRSANSSFYEHFGVRPEETEGRLVYELGNGQWNIPRLRELLDDVLPENHAFNDYKVEHDFEDLGERIMLLNARRIEHLQLILLAIEDITERERAEREMREARELAEETIDTIREPMLVLTVDLRVQSANASFYEHFRVRKEETEGRLVYELGNGQWDIPRLRALLDDVLPENKIFNDYKVEHEFEELGQRTMLLNARRIDHLQLILLVIEDVTERERSERELLEREERLRTLADNMDQFAWMADPSGWIFWYNKRWYDYTGTTLEEVQGWGWTKVHHPEHVDRVVERLQHSWDTGEPWEDVFPLRGRDGQYRWFLSRALPIRDENGRILRWFGTNTDITEQRAAEEALRESERRTNLALSAGETGTWDWDVRRGETRISGSYRELFGLAPDEPFGYENWLARVHPEDRERCRAYGEEFFSSEAATEWNIEFRILTPHRGVRWHRAVGQLERAPDGTPLRFIGVSSDITAQREAEEALRRNEEQYRTLFESIDEGFCIIEVIFEGEEAVDYRFLEVNPAFERHTGIQQPVGRRMREIAPKHEAHWFEIYGTVAKTGEPVRFQQPAQELGREFDVYAFGVGEAEPRRVAILFRDITHQKRSQEALRRRSQRLAVLSEAAKQLLETSDPRAFLDHLFQRLARLLDLELYVHFLVAPERTHLELEACAGFSDDQCRDFGRLEFGEAVCGTVARTRRPIVVSDVQDSDDPLVQLIRGLGVTAYACHPLIAGGELVGTLSFGSRTRSEFTPESVALLRAVSDLVASAIDRSRAEAAVRESESRYRRLVDQVQDYAIFSIDTDGRIASWNEGCRRVLGYERDEFLGMDGAGIFTPRDRAEGVPQRELAEAAATGEAMNDRWMLAKGGRRFFAAGATTAIHDDAGRLMGYSKVLRDETEWKRTEDALRESEERHRLAVEGGALGTWELEVETSRTVWDERAREIFGLSAKDSIELERAMAVIHPEDRERSQAAMRRTLESGEPYEMEKRVVHPDGSIRWVMTRARLYGDGVGGPRMIGVVQDITERKEHEEQMRLVMGELNHRVKNILTVVDSMAQQTLRHHPDPAAFQGSFSERIRAMAKAHSLLTAEQWKGISLESLVMSEVAHRAASPEQIHASGPRLVLRPRVAPPLHMVLHELSANAAKYGCLSTPTGRLEVSWRLEEGGEVFRLRWRESGGPPVRPPARRGFGTRLLHRAIAYQLAGEVQAEFATEGFRCDISFPWSQNTQTPPGGGAGA